MRWVGQTVKAGVVPLLFAIGCAHVYGPYFSSPGPEPTVWPSPPASARLAWDGEYRAGNDGYVRPHGVGVGEDGTICVADPGRRVVWVHQPEGRSKAIGRGHLVGPVDCVPLPGGVLVVTDSAQSRVLAFGPRGRLRWTTEKGEFGRPAGLAADWRGDRLILCDVTRHELVLLDLQGRRVGTIGRRGSAEGEFNFPTDLAVGPDGRIYVVDSMNFRIQVLSSTGEPELSFGMAGDGPGTFQRPRGVAVDAGGRIYVADALFDMIQIFDDRGRLLLALGRQGHGAGEFWMPAGLAIDSRARLLVADAYNRRVQAFRILGGKEK